MCIRPDHDVWVLETWWEFLACRRFDLSNRRPRLDRKRRSCHRQRAARRCIQVRGRKGRRAQHRAGATIGIGRVRILRVAGCSSGVRTNAGAFCGLHGYGKFTFTSSTHTNREEQASAALYAVDDVVRRKKLAETAEGQTARAAAS